LYPTADDGLDLETGDILRMLYDELAQALPQLVVGFTAERNETIIVHDRGQLDSGFIPSPLGQKMVDIGLNVVRL